MLEPNQAALEWSRRSGIVEHHAIALRFLQNMANCGFFDVLLRVLLGAVRFHWHDSCYEIPTEGSLARGHPMQLHLGMLFPIVRQHSI